MVTINYTTLRSNLSSVLDQVNDDRHPVMVTRQKGQPAVLLSLDDYRSLEETAYLLKSPENAKRLHRAMRQLENDQGSKHDNWGQSKIKSKYIMLKSRYI